VDETSPLPDRITGEMDAVDDSEFPAG
jgi:hypothetical protein